MQLLKASFGGIQAPLRGVGFYFESGSGPLRLNNASAIEPPVIMARNVLPGGGWIERADFVPTASGLRLVKAADETDERAIVLIDFGQDHYRLAIDRKIEQARQILQAGEKSTAYALIAMEPGDNVVVSRRWKQRRWFIKRGFSRFDVIRWDGRDIRFVSTTEGAFPPLSSSPAAGSEQTKVAGVTSAQLAERTPLEQAGLILTLDNASDQDLLKALQLLGSVQHEFALDEGRRAIFVDNLSVLATKFESKGNVQAAVETLRLVLLTLYSVPDDGSNEMQKQRRFFNSEIERLAKSRPSK